MVPSGNALPHRADEENRPFTASAPRADTQLLPGPKTAFERCCGGSQQQGQSHYEKILRISHLPRAGTRSLSLTWQAARAGIHPRFFLTSHNLQLAGKLTLLAEDTLHLLGQFDQILSDNANERNGIDLSHPLA